MPLNKAIYPTIQFQKNSTTIAALRNTLENFEKTVTSKADAHSDKVIFTFKKTGTADQPTYLVSAISTKSPTTTSITDESPKESLQYQALKGLANHREHKKKHKFTYIDFEKALYQPQSSRHAASLNVAKQNFALLTHTDSEESSYEASLPATQSASTAGTAESGVTFSTQRKRPNTLLANNTEAPLPKKHKASEARISSPEQLKDDDQLSHSTRQQCSTQSASTTWDTNDVANTDSYITASLANQLTAILPVPLEKYIQVLEHSYNNLIALSPDYQDQLKAFDPNSTTLNNELHSIFHRLQDKLPKSYLNVKATLSSLKSDRCLQQLTYLMCGLINVDAAYHTLVNPIPINFISEDKADFKLFSSALVFSPPLSDTEKASLLTYACIVYMNYEKINLTQFNTPSYGERPNALNEHMAYLYCIGFALHLRLITYQACKLNQEYLHFYFFSGLPSLIASKSAPQTLDDLITTFDIQVLVNIINFKLTVNNAAYSIISHSLKTILSSTFNQKSSLIKQLFASTHAKISLLADDLTVFTFSTCTSSLTKNLDMFWCTIPHVFKGIPEITFSDSPITFKQSFPPISFTPLFERNSTKYITFALAALQPFLLKKTETLLIPYFNLESKDNGKKIQLSTLLLEPISTGADGNKDIQAMLKQAVLTSLYYLPANIERKTFSINNQRNDNIIYNHWHTSAALAKEVPLEKCFLANLGTTIRLLHYLLHALHTSTHLPSEPIDILNYYKFSPLIKHAPKLIDYKPILVSQSSFHRITNDWTTFYSCQSANFKTLKSLFSPPNMATTHTTIYVSSQTIQETGVRDSADYNLKALSIDNGLFHPGLIPSTLSIEKHPYYLLHPNIGKHPSSGTSTTRQPSQSTATSVIQTTPARACNTINLDDNGEDKATNINKITLPLPMIKIKAESSYRPS